MSTSDGLTAKYLLEVSEGFKYQHLDRIIDSLLIASLEQAKLGQTSYSFQLQDVNILKNPDTESFDYFHNALSYKGYTYTISVDKVITIFWNGV